MKKLFLVSLLLTFSHSLFAQQPPAPPPPLVETELARSEFISQQIWVPGTVVSRTDAEIASEVAGRITWLAEVGDMVEAGQVLAKLDDHMLQLEQQQNLANIAKWQARVKLLDTRQQRLNAMVELNNSSRDQLDQVLSELEVARQELYQARINNRLTEYKLSQTRVKAPFKALVAARLQTQGEYTAVGKTLLRIVDTDNIEASIKAPLSAVPFIAPAMQVMVKGRGDAIEETIRTIVPVGDSRSRMMEVRVALQPGDFAIGSAVRVALPHSDFHQATTVHRDALVLRKTGAFVYTIDDQDQAQQIPVETGIGVGDRIEIIGDVSEGSQVVVRGAERLRNGQKVRFNSTSDLAMR